MLHREDPRTNISHMWNSSPQLSDWLFSQTTQTGAVNTAWSACQKWAAAGMLTRWCWIPQLPPPRLPGSTSYSVFQFKGQTIDETRLPDLFARPLATPQNGPRLWPAVVWACRRRKSQRDSSHQLWQLLHNPGTKMSECCWGSSGNTPL